MHLWPAASWLAHVPRQPLQRVAALTPGSAWSFFTISQLCPCCPLGMWQHLATEQCGGCLFRADVCLLWAVSSQNEPASGCLGEHQHLPGPGDKCQG